MGNISMRWPSLHARIYFKEWEISKGLGFFSMVTLAFLGPQHTGSIVFIGVTGRPAGLCMSLWYLLELKGERDGKIARFVLFCFVLFLN